MNFHNFGIIYAIVNKINNKHYIGQTKNEHCRKYIHLRQLKKNIHHNIYLQREWNKYKEEQFEFIVLEKCKINKLNEKETYWLLKLKKELGKDKIYNIGSTGMVNTCTEECRKRMSKVQKELWKNHELKEKQRKSHLGYKRTDESKKKESVSLKKWYNEHPEVLESKRKKMTGKKRSKEAREKASISMKRFIETHPEFKLKIIEINKKPKSEETKNKIRETLKRRFANGELKNIWTKEQILKRQKTKEEKYGTSKSIL